MSHRRSLLSLSALMPVLSLVSACAIGPAVGPDYTRPGLSAPASWLGIGQTGAAPLTWDASATQALNMPWWDDFQDPLLTQLMQEALTRNGTLKVALAKVEEARGARLAAQADTLPQIGASASAGRAKSAQSGTLGTSEQAVWDASWELDLFGKNRRTAEAARASLGQAQASARDARVRLLAEVAQTYLSVRAQQAQLAATKRSAEAQLQTLRLYQAQEAEGLTSSFAVQQVRTQQATTAAAVPLQEAALQQSVYALGVLVGRTPAAIQPLLADVKPVPLSRQRVLVGTPASVLAHRPDVAAAERALAAATANQGVAMAAWFPTISLSGFFGIANTTAVGGTNPWSAAATATLPLVDFGRVRGLVRQADARQQAALATYESTVTAALADVETALSAFLAAHNRASHLTEAAEASAKAYTMAQAQLKEGVISTLDLLTTEQTHLAAQSAKAAGDAAAGQALASLYKALGGQADTLPAQKETPHD